MKILPVYSLGLLLVVLFACEDKGRKKHHVTRYRELSTAEVKQFVRRRAQAGLNKPYKGVVISDEATAIAVAEPILFNAYGKEHIVGERPYNVYHVDTYWYLSGTLTDGSIGGVFELILDAHNSEVILLEHGE
jgi:hypothetical protein